MAAGCTEHSAVRVAAVQAAVMSCSAVVMLVHSCVGCSLLQDQLVCGAAFV